MKNLLRIFAAFTGAVLALDLAAGELVLKMEPGEHWWGLGSAFGRNMPFDGKTDFACDLRTSSYGNQTASLLLSDCGRILWCAEPVKATVQNGVIALVSDKGEIVSRTADEKTLAAAFALASRQFFPPSGETPDLQFFSAPQYNTWIELTYRQNEKDVLSYARSMRDMGLPPGILIIDDTWQLDYGIWEFDPRRFADPKGMVEKLHAMGYKVMLWICPYVSMDSPAFRLLAYGKSPDTCKILPHGGFFTRSGETAAAPVTWWNGVSALLDFSHPNARAWYADQLERLCRDDGIDGFKFDGGGVSDYLGLAAHDKTLTPVEDNARYCDFANAVPRSEYRSVFGFAGKPLVVRLSDKGHSWEALQQLVPDMLAAGLLGYPFVCPDMVGGGEYTTFLPGAPFSQDLFVRSAQVQTLCPMMQISASPARVLDAEHRKAFLAAVRLRQALVPEIVAGAQCAAKTGTPIIRSMEYAFPHQGLEGVRQQFMLGDRYLVAPVTTPENRVTVRLPAGRWRDDLGAIYEGSATLELTDVPLSRLPYYVWGD